MRYALIHTYLLIIITFYPYSRTEHVVTNPERNDGFGGQFQTIIASAIYAELNNKKYVYTPFKTMAHNYNNDPDFILKKEWLINFIDNFETINENHTVTNRHATYFINFFDSHVAACANSLVLKKIKKIFRANKKTDNYFNNQNLNIAIHIRRPNPRDDRITGTDTPDTIFLNIINQLRIIYTSKNPLFHLYSQGNKENFRLFDAPNIILHLDESTENTFIAMVLADVLVVGASSFSYAAGLLSEGTVYCLPFWHSPLPHWIPVTALLKIT